MMMADENRTKLGSCCETALEIIRGSRVEQYGDQKVNFEKYARITELLLTEEEFELLSKRKFNGVIICKMMKAIKLGRESYKHKTDNLVDLIGYSDIENLLQNENI
jgi:hypothetical protein